MEQSKEVRHDALYLVGHEHLIAIQLYLVALQVDVRLYAWEVKHTCKMEWEVNVQVNPEERLVLHWVQCTIERLVVLILKA